MSHRDSFGTSEGTYGVLFSVGPDGKTNAAENPEWFCRVASKWVVWIVRAQTTSSTVTVIAPET